MRDRQKYHERIVAAAEDPLATMVALAAAQDGRDFICYEGPQDWSFASGAAAVLSATVDGVELRTAGGVERRAWVPGGIGAIPRLLDTVPVEAWRAYGWCGFEFAAAKDGRPGLAGRGELVHLVVPEVEVRLHPSGTLLRALDPDVLDALQAALASPPVVFAPAEPLDVTGIGEQRYRDAVRRAVAAIRQGRLQKVIVSRTVPVDRPVDLVGTYAAGRAGNDPARSFLLSLDGLGAAGFSPETVVEVTEGGLVTSQPLAGTRARTGDAERDTALRTELVGDTKEVFEHAISVRAALEELGGVCAPDSTRITEYMAVRERGSVQHIASSINGRLAAGQGAWDAFAALFPAVTASGVPKRAAYEVIRELEEDERGLYGGAVLTYSGDGALDAALVLRTVFQRAGRTWLRAGAGVVEQSQPAREFTETCEKLGSVARFLVPGRVPA